MSINVSSDVTGSSNWDDIYYDNSIIQAATSSGLSFGKSTLGSQRYTLPPEIEKAKSLGGKTIGYPGSLVYTINNISGPGMLAIPLCLQQAGWLFPILCLLMIWIVSSLASTMMCEAMLLIPNNSRLNQRVEYATLVRHFFGKKAYWISQVLYNVSLITLNIASILVTAQVMDALLIFVFGKSFAIELLPSPGFRTWSSTSSTPFSTDGFLIFSLGYALTTIIFMPMGFMNLDDNIWMQFISFGVLVFLLVEFVIEFFLLGIHPSYTPIVGDLSSVLGTVMFAYTYVVTIPSWCNEKKPSVSINKSIWASSTSSTMAYIIFGVLGAWTYPNMTNSNLLDVISDDPRTGVFTEFCAYAFSLGVIGLGIPLFSIVVRYNLFVGEVCTFRWSVFWGAVFPYMVTFLFYQGEGFQIFLNWSSLIINGFINFVIPVLVYLKAKQIQWLLKKIIKGNVNINLPSFEMPSPADENFAPHSALPKWFDDHPYVILGLSLGIMAWMTYLIVLNICIDLYLIF